MSAAGYGWLAAMAVVSTVAAVRLFFAGLRRVGATTASILSTAEPLTTVVLAYLAFGESLGPAQLAGGALVLAAALVLAVPRRTRACQAAERAPCPLRDRMETPMTPSGPLAGTVALVAGATRGAGRGTAVSLGEAGATVYCTGRTTRERRSDYDRPETIEETAELVDAAGGTGIAVAVDHLEPDQVEALVRRIDAEQGRLDVLVNDIWGGEQLAQWNTPVWEHDLAGGLRMLRLAVDTHLITSHFALPLLIRRPGGLVVEMTDGTLSYNAANYRLSTFYDLAKTSVIRLAFAQAQELAPHGCTAVALTPGWMRSEMMLEHYGVTEATWREATVGSRTSPRSPSRRASSAARSPRSPPTRMSTGATAARSPRAASRASTASPTSTARSRTAGATWSRCRTPGSRPIRPATAELPHSPRSSAPMRASSSGLACPGVQGRSTPSPSKRGITCTW